MTTDRRHTQSEDAEDTLGVLDSTGAIGTADIGLLGEATAQVPVALPVTDEDDLVDDDVTEGEAFADLVLEADPAAFVREDDGIGRIHQGAGISDIVIEIPAIAADEAVVVAELVDNDESAEPPTADAEPEADVDGAPEDAPEQDESAEPDAEPAAESDVVPVDADAHPEELHDVAHAAPEVLPVTDVVDVPEAPYAEPEAVFEVSEHAAGPSEDRSARGSGDIEAEDEGSGSLAAPSTPVEATQPAADLSEVSVPADADPAEEPAAEAVVLRAVEPVLAPVPAAHIAAPAVEEEIMTDDHARVPEPELAARRLDQLSDRQRESADLLTADRLLDTSRLAGPEPEGLWSHLLYTISGRRINLGDGKRAQQRKALSARIAAPLPGTARFVPVLSRKGGVGKTTVTALLGMALADAREDRVIAVDANPDRGTLADRIARTNTKTVRDLVRIHDQVTGYHDISAVVSRDATRLDVLASDTDPRVSEAFNDEDYDQVASVAAHYYSLVLTDTGTGIVHAVMGATLDRADTIVIVAGLSVDEARLASETLTWLETNGYADKVRDAVVVLNQSTPGSPMVRLSELEAHFRTRVAHVLRIPYDPRIAAGSAISFAALQPETRQAARELAAVVVEGLRAQAA
ncbi:MinD-like ATPase involved in chromosome partitioning or flagellar assembly [Microbacterium azadirachtae]|uniref:MinD-like ATPase involved in chromosome partitioning or flagellar assembly n=1 Tax=Microbacterium azadirachtae TaxID=582680 RepID=A0A1I6FP70_9MICO|nr:MinD/ParA family protein [Microbacterium azadirachtae]SFR31739.1 MinD-like ATPase involved in chromosome partitioning or flagellar assembly [Microbacterium azadirachtae]